MRSPAVVGVWRERRESQGSYVRSDSSAVHVVYPDEIVNELVPFARCSTSLALMLTNATKDSVSIFPIWALSGSPLSTQYEIYDLVRVYLSKVTLR